ncbi:hypothetical protein BGZ74_001451 [Mortierella antarctica]|nr:hypothetical protein BGZ74_001451 [Mortierella antarctica]
MMQARSIPTQNSPSPSPHSYSPAAMSPSGSSQQKGNRTLNVVDFAQARAFEINAMHTAMKHSKDSAAQRAFQSLPRNLRRRAASHNIKRLPVRLRERAMREVESDPVKKGKKPDNRHKKRRPGTITQEYLRRQGTKRWLETHIWHAKRMKMVEQWGYKLAEHSNEHGIKSAYKSSHHQCILQDSSYNGCLEITGPKKSIVKLFDHMLDPSMPTIGSARYIDGRRQYFTYLYECDSFPQSLIAPATFLWKQEHMSSEETMDVDELSKIGQLWVWIHPSAFDKAHESIKKTLADLKLGDVGITDLENALVTFDFTGPRSTALLQAVLHPCTSGNINKDAHKVWDTISHLRTSSSLPPGVVLSLLVEDPRLTFPHKASSRPATIPTETLKDTQDLIAHWPKTAAVSTLWSAQERDRLLANMVSEGTLNQRRAANLVPGTKLAPTAADAQIPVLLVQREGKPQISRAPGGGSSEFECGWSLILPKGWGMAFWKSFIFAGARPGGLRERRSFHFETRQSCFPYDFPNTSAYDAYAAEAKTEAQAKYDRKPVAKRINYAKFGVEDPFGAAWIKCLRAGMAGLGAEQEQLAGLDEKKVWLLQTPALFSAMKDFARSVVKDGEQLTIALLNKTLVEGHVQDLLKKRSLESVLASPRIEEALVRVGVDFLNRGTIGMNGMIYMIPEDTYQEWATRAGLKGKRALDGQPRHKKEAKSWVDDSDDEMEEDDKDCDDLEMIRPPPETLLGYVTTGQYCYSEGKNYGIGCCSALGLARLIAFESKAGATPASGSKVPKMMVLVRSVRSKASRLAKLTVLS